MYNNTKYFNICKTVKVFQYNSVDVRQFIISIVRYIVNLENFNILKKLNKNKEIIYNRLMVFMLLPNGFKTLDFYKDRKNYSVLLIHLWKLQRYIHLLTIEDQIIFKNLLEFLIDYWILCDNIKTFRHYLNMHTNIYSLPIQLLFGKSELFSKNNFSKFLLYYNEKKLDKTIYPN
jgi:hypothetical protein